MEILETNRLTLRPLTLDDADDIFVAYSDAETMRFMSGPPHENASQTRNYLQMSMMRKGCAYWAICEKDSDTALGFVNYLGKHAFRDSAIFSGVKSGGWGIQRKRVGRL